MGRWDGIDEFVAVATHGSFAAAATALGLSRSHMSRAVADLEDRLQVLLLQRTTRKVRLTASGEVFLDHARRLLSDRDEAIAMMLEKSEPQGDLSITCSTALGERFVAPLARAFAREHPKIRLTLDLSNRVTDLIAEGFDLAVRTGVLPSSSLIATKIAERRLFACASADYLHKAGVPQSVDDLNRHDCVVGTSGIWHFAVDGVERLYRPNSRWRCNNGQAVLAAALEGMGICQLPDFYVQEAFRKGTLVPVLPEFTAPVEPIWAVYPGRKHLAPKVRQFVDLLKEHMPASLAGI